MIDTASVTQFTIVKGRQQDRSRCGGYTQNARWRLRLVRSMAPHC